MVCPDIYLHTLGVTKRDQPPWCGDILLQGHPCQRGSGGWRGYTHRGSWRFGSQEACMHFFFQTQTFRIARTRKKSSIEVFVRKLLEDGLHYICLCIFAGFGFTVFVRKLLWSRDLHTCRGGNTNDLLHLIKHETILFNFQRHRWLELREYRETTSLPSLAEQKSPIRLLGLNGRSRRSTNSSTTNNEGARAVFNQSSDCLKCPRQCYIYGSVSKPCNPGEHQNSW